MQTETNADTLTAIDLTSPEADRPPDFLYRYRAVNEYRKQILVDNLLYFSSPKNFNDPVGCRMPTELSGSPDDVRSCCERRIDEHWPSIPLDQKIPMIDRFISERRWANTACDVQPKIYDCGVLCLRERWDIPCIWKRYAEYHSGVCLEFLAADEKGLTGFGSHSFQVTYSEQPTLNLLLDPWEQAKQILLTKSTKWRYEEEWRIILLAPSGQLTVRNIPFLPEFLTGVIFGYKADDATKKQVEGWLAEGNCHPTLYRGKLDGVRLSKERIE